ncbi:MAG: GLUG motif-containing protein, partial [Planctomycetota bacterium]
VDCPGEVGEFGPDWTAVGFDDSGWGTSVAPWSPIGDLETEMPGGPAAGVQWMWMDSRPNEAFFRKTFLLHVLPDYAETKVTADDNFQLYVNGILVSQDLSGGSGPLVVLNISPYLNFGNNVLAIRAWDSYGGCNVNRRGNVGLAVWVANLPAQVKYGGGIGTPGDPYQIWDANHMQAIGADANDWDKCFKLMADIDLADFTGTSFNIIGSIVWHRPFTGTFDGNGHKISNFSYTYTDKSRIGLFGYVRGENAEIKDLGLIAPDVDARTGDYVGSLVGYLRDGTITNCYVDGASVTGDDRVGGLLGGNHGTITNCYSTGSVTGDRNVGGLVGGNGGTITNCYAGGGRVTGNRYVGGLVGWNNGTIIGCYSTGSVSANGWFVGGLVGWNNGTIIGCYSTGSVSGTNKGGLVGYGSGHVFTSYWDIETSGQANSGGGKGKTTAQMMMASTFLHWGTCDGVWTINEGVDYPRLAWEQRPGEPIVGAFPLQGDGVPDNPYLIHTPEQLNVIGLLPCVWDKHFKLMENIDLSKYTGTEFNIIVRFSGTFDGNGHTISNFTYTSTSTSYIGLFGYVTGEIKDLGLIDPNLEAVTGSLVGYSDGIITNCYAEGGSVSGGGSVGGLVGFNWKGTITNSYSSASVSGSNYVGGLVGYNDYGTINNCYSMGSVSGDDYVGGMVGNNYHGTIANCYSTGSVWGNVNIGGLVGWDYGTITNSYSSGNVSGDWYVGGLVGRNWSTITGCYSTGSVSGTTDVGGLVGYGFGHVVSSYWDIETSGQAISAGGKGKTTAQMMMASTFLHWGTCDEVWTINEGVDYPRLTWEQRPGEPIVGAFPLQGDGVPDSPYLIYTPEQLNIIGLLPCVWDKHFKLMANIDLSQYAGTDFNIIVRFTGTFDGNGHTISNFTCTSTGTNYIGLFGYVTGEIKNLGFIDPNVDVGTGSRVGSLVGRLDNGTINNCYVEGGSISGDWYVGGLVGRNYYGIITNCYSTADVLGNDRVGGLVGENVGTITNCYSSAGVSGDRYTGGLVGLNMDGSITNCYSTASVTGDKVVGGLVGENIGTITNCYSHASVTGNKFVGELMGYNCGTTTNCYSTGSVSGDERVGGLVGDNWGGTITNCYSIGDVTGDHCVGGLVGANSYYGTISNSYSTGSVSGTEGEVGGLVGRRDYRWVGEVNNSFWDIETSGQDWSDGGTGLPTDQMQMAGTFTDAGWDFVGETDNGTDDIWFIPEGNYPHLWWKGIQVSMKLTPRTLNCRSQGNWVKAHLTLPEGFTVADVDHDRPAVLHSLGFQSAPLYVFVNKDKLVQIEAAFEREALCSLAGDWPQELTVAGFLADGNIFLGTSTVRIIHPGMNVIEELAWYWLNADCVQPDFCNGIDMNRDSLVNLLDYALLMNINVEFLTDE